MYGILRHNSSKKKSNLKVQMTSLMMSQEILQPHIIIVLLKVLIEVTTAMQISHSKHSADDKINLTSIQTSQTAITQDSYKESINNRRPAIMLKKVSLSSRHRPHTEK